jgi:hypothetical protein
LIIYGNTGRRCPQLRIDAIGYQDGLVGIPQRCCAVWARCQDSKFFEIVEIVGFSR